jgi:hypothetical protein
MHACSCHKEFDRGTIEPMLLPRAEEETSWMCMACIATQARMELHAHLATRRATRRLARAARLYCHVAMWCIVLQRACAAGDARVGAQAAAERPGGDIVRDVRLYDTHLCIVQSEA